MNEFFWSALTFGLASGIKPGALGIFVIQQTLSRGLPAGIRASFAPLITDGPILFAAFWLLGAFKSIEMFAVAMHLIGGAYLLWLARRMLRVPRISLSAKLQQPSSLATAVKLNFLNPGPYLFWFTVGGSYLVRGTVLQNAVFVLTSVAALIATKIAVAIIARRFLPTIESRGYLLTMKLLAFAMLGFGLDAVWRGVRPLLSL